MVITSTLDSSYVPAGGTALGTTGSASLQLKGNNIGAANITFANSTDTPYIVHTAMQAVSPTGSYATGQAQTSNSPAVALLLQGDEQVFNDVKVLGYQDTLYTKGGRSYFTNSTVSGDVDFIFANGTTVFNNSTINLDGDHSGGDITAASTDKRTSNGLVFLNSTVTGNSVTGNPATDPMNAANANRTGRQFDVSGPAVGLDTDWRRFQHCFCQYADDFRDHNPAGWLAWDSTETTATNNKNGGNPGEDSRFAEYNSMDLSGQSVEHREPRHLVASIGGFTGGGLYRGQSLFRIVSMVWRRLHLNRCVESGHWFDRFPPIPTIAGRPIGATVTQQRNG